MGGRTEYQLVQLAVSAAWFADIALAASWTSWRRVVPGRAGDRAERQLDQPAVAAATIGDG